MRKLIHGISPWMQSFTKTVGLLENEHPMSMQIHQSIMISDPPLR
jgi:hypothetical protein